MGDSSSADEKRMTEESEGREFAYNGSAKGLSGLIGRSAFLALMIMLSSFMLAACSGNAAVSGVRADLDMLKASKAAGSRLSSMQEILTKESGADFDAFLSKLRDFDYEITGSETHNEGGKSYTSVRVRIHTYDFGREYLATWKDYLREHGSASDDEDMREFYGELFGRLAGLRSRDYIRDVEIVTVEPLDNGEVITDISSNEELQDALFGGMIGEMEALAGE